MKPTLNRYYTFVRPILKHPRFKTYSSLVFNLIALVIFSYFAIRPTIKTILSLQKDIALQKDTLNQLNTKAQNLSLGKASLTTITPSTVARLNNLLPSKTNLPDMIYGINQLSLVTQASISGLQFQPVSLVQIPDKLNPKATIKEVPFTLNLVAPYPNLVSFLNLLIDNDRLVSIDSVNISQSPDRPLIMSVNAKAYYLEN